MPPHGGRHHDMTRSARRSSPPQACACSRPHAPRALGAAGSERPAALAPLRGAVRRRCPSCPTGRVRRPRRRAVVRVRRRGAARARRRLVAVDVSQEELALNPTPTRRSSPTSRRGLPFADGEVDLLVSRVVLEHVDGVPRRSATCARDQAGRAHDPLRPRPLVDVRAGGASAPVRPAAEAAALRDPELGGVVEFDVHYDHTDPVALERVFREAGFRDVRMAGRPRRPGTSGPSCPPTCSSRSTRRSCGARAAPARGLRDRRRAPLSELALGGPLVRWRAGRSSTSRIRCSRIAWRWASTFDWSLSRDIAAEKCSRSSRMKPTRDEEQRVRRGDDPHLAREHGQRVLPDGEPEDHERAEQPQQRVALHQRAGGAPARARTAAAPTAPRIATICSRGSIRSRAPRRPAAGLAGLRHGARGGRGRRTARAAP